MRLIGILVSALVAILSLVVAVVLPPVFGTVARSTLDDLDRGVRVAQAFGTDAELAVLFDDWDAGWFSSTASMWLRAEFGGVTLFSSEFPVPVTVRHGPMISGTPSGLGWASIELILDGSVHPDLQEFYEETGLDEVVRFGLLLGLGGSTRAGIDVPAFRVEEPDGDEWMDFRGIRANADLAADVLDFDGEFGGLRYGSQYARVEVGGIALAADMSRDSRMPMLWLGGVQADSDGFEILADDGRSAEMGDIRVHLDTEIIRGVLHASLQGDVSHLDFPVPDTNGNAQLRLDGLGGGMALRYDADSLADFMELVQTGSATSPEAVLRLAGSLVRERLFFSIERLSFSHEGRSAGASLEVEFRGDELPGLDIERLSRLATNPARLPISVDFNLAFEQDLPRGLVRSLGGGGSREARQLDSAIQDLVAEDVLQEDGDDYTLRAEFDEGELYLNGEPLDRVMRQLGGQRSDAGRMLRELVLELGIR